jgi:hypothetical protein
LNARQVYGLLALTGFGDLPAAWASVIAALLAALIATISLAVNATSGRRERRRNLYSEAYRTTMSWVEMAYRVHHAPPNDEELLAAYHKLWEDLRYYEGWVIFESPQLGYSYARFKEAVERVCDNYIETAWSQRSGEPRPLVELPVESRPETYQQELDSFLEDVRDHLSPYPWRRAAMNRRVRRRIQREGGARVSGLPMKRRSAETMPRVPAS